MCPKKQSLEKIIIRLQMNAKVSVNAQTQSLILMGDGNAANGLCYISWNAYHELLCFRSPWTFFFFFLLNQRSLKNWSPIELDMCWYGREASLASSSLWTSWRPPWLCHSALGGVHVTAKGRSVKQALVRGGTRRFEIWYGPCDCALWIVSESDLCSNSGFATC